MSDWISLTHEDGSRISVRAAAIIAFVSAEECTGGSEVWLVGMSDAVVRVQETRERLRALLGILE